MIMDLLMQIRQLKGFEHVVDDVSDAILFRSAILCISFLFGGIYEFRISFPLDSISKEF
jgi:hypothetical protein